MLYYILVFFLLSVVSAAVGFGNLAGTFSQIAKILSIIFLALLIFSAVMHLI